MIGWFFNAVFNSFSVISRGPVHLSMLSWSSFKLVLCTVFFPGHWLLSHITIVETTDSGERNESCRNDNYQSSGRILAEPGIELATSCSQVRNASDWAMGLGSLFLSSICCKSESNTTSDWLNHTV